MTTEPTNKNSEQDSVDTRKRGRSIEIKTEADLPPIAEEVIESDDEQVADGGGRTSDGHPTIEGLQTELEEARDQVLRAQAELDNFRKSEIADKGDLLLRIWNRQSLQWRNK